MEVDLSSLASALRANAEKRVVQARVDEAANVSLLVGGLESLATAQSKLIERIDASDKENAMRFRSLEDKMLTLTTSLETFREEAADGDETNALAVSSVEQDVDRVVAQVEMIVKALKVGRQVRKEALTGTVKKVLANANNQALFNKSTIMLQRRFRQLRSESKVKLQNYQERHSIRHAPGKPKKIRHCSSEPKMVPGVVASARTPVHVVHEEDEDAEEEKAPAIAAPVGAPLDVVGEPVEDVDIEDESPPETQLPSPPQEAPASAPRMPQSIIPEATAPSSQQPEEEDEEEQPRSVVIQEPPAQEPPSPVVGVQEPVVNRSRSATLDLKLADLHDMLDDGSTAEKLMQVEEEFKKRIAALEAQCQAMTRQQDHFKSGLQNIDGSTRTQLAGIPGIVIPIAQKMTEETLESYCAKNFKGGTSALELRRDLNVLTHFADELQKEQRTFEEDLKSRPDPITAIALKEVQDDDHARTACVRALRELTDALAARRSQNLISSNNNEPQDEPKSDDSDDPSMLLEAIDVAACGALHALENDDTAPGTKEKRPLPPAASVELRVLTALLDSAGDYALETVMPTSSAVGHAASIANVGTIEQKTWAEALGALLEAIRDLLDKHASPTRTDLDILRLRAELNGLPNAILGRQSRFALGDHDGDDDSKWRESELVSRILRRRVPKGEAKLLYSRWSDLAVNLDRLNHRVEVTETESSGTRKMATAARRHVQTLDDAVGEVVVQMKQGFASQADVRQVHSALAQLGARLKSTKDDLETTSKALASEYAEKVKSLADGLAAKGGSLDYSRLEALLKRKADVGDIESLRGQLDQYHGGGGFMGAAGGGGMGGPVFFTKCLACNRPLPELPQTLPDCDPATSPPKITMRPTQGRVAGLFVPGGGVQSPDSTVEVRSVSSNQTYVLNDDGFSFTSDVSQPRLLQVTVPKPPVMYETVPKKTVALHVANTTENTDVVIPRAGANNRLMPLQQPAKRVKK